MNFNANANALVLLIGNTYQPFLKPAVSQFHFIIQFSCQAIYGSYSDSRHYSFKIFLA